MIRLLCFTVILIILSSNILWAQPDNNSIDERVRVNDPVIIQDNNPLYIDENLVLLKKPKFWTAYLLPSTQYTDNVFLDENDQESDWISSVTGGINFNIRTQNNFSLSAGVAASKFYYHDNSTLDYDSLQGSIDLSYNHDDWLFSIQYAPALVFEQDFNDRLLTLHRFSGSASKSYALWDKIVLLPFSNLHYVAADPQEFSYSQIDTGIRAVYPINSKFVLSLTPQTYHKRYDDYFESQTGEERRDTGARIDARLTYKVKENIDFVANIGYGHNNSTLSNSTYDVTTLSPTLQFTYKF